MRQGWLMLANDDFLSAPATSKSRRQFTTDPLVQIEKKLLVQWTIVEITLSDRVLNLLDPKRQVRRKLGVAQGAECRIEVSGC